MTKVRLNCCYISTCETCIDTKPFLFVVGVNRSDIKAWMESTLRDWHANDPVENMEISRNDIIYK